MIKKMMPVKPRPRPITSCFTIRRVSRLFDMRALAPVAGRKHTNGVAADGLCDEELLYSKRHPDSFLSVVRHLLIVGHYIGVLPAPTNSGCKFRWLSLHVVFSVGVTAAVAFRIIVYLYCVFVGYMTFFDTVVSTRIGFTVLGLLMFVTYIRLASRWRKFVVCFLRIEHRQGSLEPAGIAPSLSLRRRVVLMTMATLALGFLEVLLQQFTFPLSRDLDEYDSFSDILADHYYGLFNHIATAVSYNPAVLFAAEFSSAVTNFVLNYNDLFIMIVSMVIVRRFKHQRKILAVNCFKDSAYWKSARERFHDLSELTREVDQHVSVQVLLSCLNNFFSICIQLQHAVSPPFGAPCVLRRMYYCFSLLFVVVRSGAVMFAASSIPEESRALKRALYSVPSNQYTAETQRFLTQVISDDVTLTGLGLFTINRSFILRMLGTIATYEILLFQTYRSEVHS
ncbi:gustatory receptor for sugar taste 64f-like [Thrips palmi]|uniref:Gustatory receptor n=1 Tax=Thrips palmi TaxID=161013 RepID=A0A6P8YS26_THRPL|nr:gustatory receptor for sugar taste 64f-like [Thrips palmi]